MTSLTDQPSWRQLQAHYANSKRRSQLERTKAHRVEVAALSIDYSRNHLDDSSLSLFSELADSCELSSAIERLVNGGVVNVSEQRAAWHTILRDPSKQTEVVKACYAKMRELASSIRKRGITDIIHIGIGGSYLGPRFLYDVFASISDPHIRVHFLANQNQSAIQQLLKSLDPETTMAIVVSKSFTTSETMTNAKPIVDWLQSAFPKMWQQHLLAVTAQTERARAFGALSDHIFPMWDWVGGRFSLWSAVSFSIVLAFGWECFEALLQGAHTMDQHYQSQSWSSNMPVMLAFIGILYRHFFHAQTQAVVPYHHALTRLPLHLQQLHMESLAKPVTQMGNPIDYPTGAIIWGGTGPGSQHSFHQLLLQGHDCVPVDFIAVREEQSAYRSCLAQAKALLVGNPNKAVPLSQRLSGNRPSTIISMQQLSPEKIGALLALYEHKVFTQAVIWNINAFDQWGVEAGKKLL